MRLCVNDIDEVAIIIITMMYSVSARNVHKVHAMSSIGSELNIVCKHHEMDLPTERSVINDKKLSKIAMKPEITQLVSTKYI